MNGDKKELSSEYELSLKYINLYFEYTKNKPDDNILQAKYLKDYLESKIHLEKNTKYTSNDKYHGIMEVTNNAGESQSFASRRVKLTLKSLKNKKDKINLDI